MKHLFVQGPPLCLSSVGFSAGFLLGTRLQERARVSVAFLLMNNCGVAFLCSKDDDISELF